jgi:hypothetical protein
MKKMPESQRQAVEALLGSKAEEADPLLAEMIALGRAGELESVIDLGIARWVTSPDDPSGPWNVVRTLDARGEFLWAGVLKFLTHQLIKQHGHPTIAEDDDWVGNSLAFAIDDVIKAGALASAAAMVSYLDDPEERQEYADVIRARLREAGA